MQPEKSCECLFHPPFRKLPFTRKPCQKEGKSSHWCASCISEKLKISTSIKVYSAESCWNIAVGMQTLIIIYIFRKHSPAVHIIVWCTCSVLQKLVKAKMQITNYIHYYTLLNLCLLQGNFCVSITVLYKKGVRGRKKYRKYAGSEGLRTIDQELSRPTCQN